MLTLTASRKRHGRRGSGPARGLFGRPEPRLAGTGAGEWSAWMRSAAKAWLEIASTSGICVALQRMRRFRVLRPAEGLLGANASWRVWRTPLDPSKAQHRHNAVFVAFVNSAASDRLDRLRDFGRDRRVFSPTNFGARPIWSGRTSFR